MDINTFNFHLADAINDLIPYRLNQIIKSKGYNKKLKAETLKGQLNTKAIMLHRSLIGKRVLIRYIEVPEDFGRIENNGTTTDNASKDEPIQSNPDKGRNIPVPSIGVSNPQTGNNASELRQYILRENKPKRISSGSNGRTRAGIFN